MAMQEFKMYMVVGTGSCNHGQVQLTPYKPSLKVDSTTHMIGVRLLKEVECQCDVPEFDLRSMEIEALEKGVIAEKADSQVRVNLLLDRLSKLKAIGHDAPVAAEFVYAGSTDEVAV
jgi:hypothetical protein